MVIASPSPGIADAAAISIPTAIACSTVISTATVVASAAVVPTATPISVIPGSRADEEAAYEPARSVVAIGRAGVGIIIVITPGTNRSRIPIVAIPIVTTDPNTDSDLGVRRS
jgi:hypothetical protein